MKNHAVLLVSLLLGIGISPALGQNKNKQYISVVPTVMSKSAAKSPAESTANKTKAKEAPAAQVKKSENATAAAIEEPNQENQGDSTGEPAPQVRSFYSSQLEQAVAQYRSSPSGSTHAQMLAALKGCLLSAGGLRVSPAILVKDNPYLNDFKPRLLESNAVRIWTFPKAPEKNRILLQWIETHQQVVGTGRRKRVLTSTSSRLQELSLTQNLNIKDAGIVTIKDSGKYLILAADAEDGSLQTKAYKLSEGGWQDSPEFLAQIPEFLKSNVCGRLSIRGNDLIFTVGKMLEFVDSSGSKKLMPEAESACYKFWLKLTDTGYVMAPALPNEEAFSVVYQFLQAVSQSRTDLAKSLLADPRLASLPKYLGLQGKAIDSASRVVEMPANRNQRYRLINIGKDDLIFDVTKAKGQWQIKAIFVAPPDQFLAQTSKYFPAFSRFEAKAEQEKEKAEAQAASVSAAGAGIHARKK